MQQLALQAKSQVDGQPAGPKGSGLRRPARRGAQLIVLAWFSLGVLTSGAAGVAALERLRALEARGTPLTWASVRESLGSTLASAWAMMPAVPVRSRWERVEVRIASDRRADAPLGLSVTGGDGRPTYFVIDGLPEGVRPSRGGAVGPSTWVVSSTDIQGLHLIMDDGAPSRFDLKVAVLEPGGVAKSGSVLRVRVVDEPPPTAMAASAAEPPDTAAKALVGGIGP